MNYARVLGKLSEVPLVALVFWATTVQSNSVTADDATTSTDSSVEVAVSADSTSLISSDAAAAQSAAFVNSTVTLLQTSLVQTATVSAIQNLHPIDSSALTTRMAPFKQHADDRSLLDVRPAEGSILDNAASVPASARSAVKNALQFSIDSTAETKLRTAVLSPLTGDQRWTFLDSLENAKDFATAAAMADAMLTDETDAAGVALLHLTAARNLWMSRAGNPANRYEDHLAQACAAADSTVATQAKMWKEALSQPSSPEEVILLHQIWKSVYLESGYREKGIQLTNLIVTYGPGVYDTLKAKGATDETSLAQRAHVLAIISQAAEQLIEPKIMLWAIDEAKQIPLAACEYTLAPQYFYAYRTMASGDTEHAVERFEPVFLSGVQCDLAADAGFQVATCYDLNSDPLATAATIELVDNMYPDQERVKGLLTPLRDQLASSKVAVDQLKVLDYINQNYTPKISRLKQATSPVKQAEAKPAQKKS